jgi:hypothetical protein
MEDAHMRGTMLIAVALLAAGACRGGEPKQTAAADSLSRNLQLAPVDTSKPLADAPAAAPAPAPQPTPPPPPPTPKAKPKPKPKPAAKPAAAPAAKDSAAAAPAAAPAAAAPAALDAGTAVSATILDTINSRNSKPGDKVRAKVGTDIADATGKVVIPAGSTVNLTIASLQGGKNGSIQLTPTDVMIGGKSYPLDATVDSVQFKVSGRGVGGAEIGKTAAGVGVGAIIGKIIGGGTGAAVGAVVGGAAGAGVAAKTAKKDVVALPGDAVRMTLKSKLVLTS